jgi:hypothetical protein
LGSLSRRAYQRWKRPRNSREQQQQRANFFFLQIKTYYSLPNSEAVRKKKKFPLQLKMILLRMCGCVGRISLSSDERAPRLKFFPVAPTHLNQSHTVISHPHLFFFLFPPLEKFVL